MAHHQGTMVEGLETPTNTDQVLRKVILIEEATTPIVEVSAPVMMFASPAW